MNKTRAIVIVLCMLVLLGTSVRAQLASEGPIENPIRAKDEMDAKILKAMEEIREGPSYANVSVRDGRLLRLLTESVNAQTVVEIGTSTGESAVWFALALERTSGHLYTHEIDKERAQIARENFKKAGVEDLITLAEGDVHESVLQYEEPIDIVFLDADKPGGLIIAHNMNYPRPDP